MFLFLQEVNKLRARSSAQSGSVFTTLLAAAAMVGAISYTTYQTMSGPVATMMRTTQKNVVDTQMTTTAKLLIAASAGTDCDGDNYIEPPQWTVASDPALAPENGGLLPVSLGLPLVDSWGTPYGYCAWDVGSANDIEVAGTDAVNCPADALRLEGTTTPTSPPLGLQTVLAVVSAGPDRMFDTTCKDFTTAIGDSSNDVIATTLGKDDLVVRYSYTQASGATSALWQLSTGTPSAAETQNTAPSLAVGDISDFNATTGVITALNFISSGVVSALGGLMLADETSVPDEYCTGGREGALRYNAGDGLVEFCGGAGPDWTALSAGGGVEGGTDVNGIDVLSDGVAEYSALNIVGLGRGALCQYSSVNAGNWCPNTGFQLQDVTAAGTPVAFVSDPDGGGNPDIETIRDDVFPPQGSGDSALQYDTYRASDAGTRTEDWIGYTYGADHVFARVVWQEGRNFADGGWFTGLKVQVRQSGVWVDVPSVVTSPAYPGVNNSVNYETYTFTFPDIAGDGIRVFGTPMGTETYTSTGEMHVYAREAIGSTPLNGGAGSGLALGTGNTAVGIRAQSLSETGGNNTAFGYQSLMGNTAGNNNTGFGYQALRDNAVGSDNTGAGFSSMAASSHSVGSNAIALRSYATAEGTGAVTAPGDIVAGDLLLFVISGDGCSPGATFPAGFTELYDVTCAGWDETAYALAWKTADGSEAGNTLTATLPWACCGTPAAILLVYSGVVTSNPIDVSSHHPMAPGGTLGPWTMTGDSMTTTTEATSIVYIGVADPCCEPPDPRLFAPPPGYTARVNHSANHAPLFIADTVYPGIGATGDASGVVTGYPSDSMSWAVMLVALRPAGASVGGTVAAENTAAGYAALESNVSGSQNTAAGYYALSSNYSGNRNTAAGYRALAGSGIGNDNTALGRTALEVHQGDGATAAGEAALSSSFGAGNTAAGRSALAANTSGAYNTAVGANALNFNSTADYNTALGYRAIVGSDDPTQGFCLAAGTYAMYDNGVFGITGIGKGVLYATTYNYPLTVVGYESAELLTNDLSSNYGANHVTAFGYGNIASSSSTLQDARGVVTAGYWAGRDLRQYANGVSLLGAYAGYNMRGDSSGVDFNLAIGYRASLVRQQGRTVTVVGASAAQNRTDHSTIAMGYNAQQSALTGEANVSIGHSAHTELTTGGYNIAIGSLAGLENDELFGALAIGYRTASQNEDRGQSTALGYAAMAGLVSLFEGPERSIAIGARALASGVSWGNGVTFFGAGAGEDASDIVNAMPSAGYGFESAKSLDEAEQAVGIGWRALRDVTSGDRNTAIGAGALYRNTTSNENAGIGYAALGTVTGRENTAIGAGAMAVGTSSDYNTAVGFGAMASNIGGDENAAMGYNALSGNTSGNYNVAFGAAALSVNTTGTYNVAIGYSAGPSASGLTNTIAIGNGAAVSSDNTVRFGNASVTSIGGYQAWTHVSDRRAKKDITDSDLALDFIMRLRPVSYRLKTGNGRLDYGFIAQEIEAALEGRVANMVMREDDADKTYRLRAADLIAPAVKAVQQQQAAALRRQQDIDAMKADVLEIQSAIADLREVHP